jgi:hypothetical protein
LQSGECAEVFDRINGIYRIRGMEQWDAGLFLKFGARRPGMERKSRVYRKEPKSKIIL